MNAKSAILVVLAVVGVVVPACDLLGAKFNYGERLEGLGIAFLSRRIEGRADWRLYMMKPTGKNQKLVTSKTVAYDFPEVSPEGKRVAFVHPDDGACELYVKNLRGDRSALVARGTRTCGQAAWSPDGERIAYVKNRASTEKKSLYVAGPYGESPVALVDSGDAGAPSWSPEGGVLAFSESASEERAGVYTIHVDGSNRQRLTSHGSSPTWSPDGEEIAFVSGKTGSGQIYVVNADGKNLRQLTSTVGPDRWPGWPPKGNATPAWSPDGETIAFTSWRNGDPDIFVMDKDGLRQRQLTASDERDIYPVWSPFGRYLLFQSDRNQKMTAEIFIMKRDGSAAQPLTNYTRGDVLPAWVPARQ